MTTRQCPSCGGICKKGGCERANIYPVVVPAWHDTPTCAGLWLCNLDMQAYHLPDPEIDLGGGNKWYGPIPGDRS